MTENATWASGACGPRAVIGAAPATAAPREGDGGSGAGGMDRPIIGTR